MIEHIYALSAEDKRIAEEFYELASYYGYGNLADQVQAFIETWSSDEWSVSR